MSLQLTPVRQDADFGYASFDAGRVSFAVAKTDDDSLVGRQAGVSLHAGVACKSNQRKKLARVCRYIARPAMAEQRLSLARTSLEPISQNIITLRPRRPRP